MNERQEHVFVVCAIVDARSGIVGANLPVRSTRSGGQSSPNTHLHITACLENIDGVNQPESVSVIPVQCGRTSAGRIYQQGISRDILETKQSPMSLVSVSDITTVSAAAPGVPLFGPAV
ncbi:hypothetical protein TESG_07921 [Trichophyton tonsurans CBS 112818]|uniref:Uncharacterized protein n=1 Tax=Trichophyton tonsurans (strain CBS 112818) TaxID=647933 RepID=F2SAM0_TRIT1|nr:hypothetical protein TESG_07921 [Trichophyton tonsurans CBS 112818]